MLLLVYKHADHSTNDFILECYGAEFIRMVPGMGMLYCLKFPMAGGDLTRLGKDVMSWSHVIPVTGEEPRFDVWSFTRRSPNSKYVHGRG